MKLFSQCSLFFLIFCSLPIFAEYKLAGEGPVRITKVEIEAGMKVDATYFNQDGTDFYFTADWKFYLDKSSLDKAMIEVIFDLGDHYVLAKSNRRLASPDKISIISSIC